MTLSIRWRPLRDNKTIFTLRRTPSLPSSPQMVVVGLSYRPRRGPRGTEAILVGLRAKRANDAAGLKEEEGDAEAGASQARALWPRQGGEKYGQFFNVHFAKIGLLPRRLLLLAAPSCSLASSFAFTVVDQVQGPISSLHLILFILSPICMPAYNMITEQVMAICIRTACVTSLVFFRARLVRHSLFHITPVAAVGNQDGN